MQSYYNFLRHSTDIPEGFEILDNKLHFHGIDLMKLIGIYETPLRFTYLPIISTRINYVRNLFQQAMERHNYHGKYTYCYCTKSSPFQHVMIEALNASAHIETSSSMDIPVIEALEQNGYLDKQVLVLANGYKNEEYLSHICDLIHDGYRNVIPILDNKDELNFYESNLNKPMCLGIRMATEEPPESHFYTSRLGIREDEILPFYRERLAKHPEIELKLLHFFVPNGIHDRPSFWSELRRLVELYCTLHKENEKLTILDIGGGLPFRNALDFDYDYTHVIGEIVRTIKSGCAEHDVPEPNLLTEFGSFTVAESSGTLFRVLGRKQQNDREKWLMIDGSVMSMLPDVWALDRRFILLPINNWEMGYEKAAIGGMTCDNEDYYGEDLHQASIFMPSTHRQQYIGFFHTGAYQEVLSGVGGLHHCLMPDPKHVVISVDRQGNQQTRVLQEGQNSKQTLKILGYR